MNDLAQLSISDRSKLSELASDLINAKWPAKDNDYDIFNFIFECNGFLKGFFLIGFYLYR